LECLLAQCSQEAEVQISPRTLLSASAIFLCSLTCALGKPVTTADLAGRTICYNNGEKATYYSDGRYENNVIGNGTWSVTSTGVDLETDSLKAIIAIEIMADGIVSIPRAGMSGTDCK
jgi:hypothetical protein